MKKHLFLLLVTLLFVTALVGCHPAPKYTVRFVIDEQIVVKDVKEGKVELPQDPAKEGYSFDGWYVSVDGQEVSFYDLFPNGEGIDRDLEVFAKWREVVAVHHVTFYAQPGEELVIKEVPNGTLVETPIPVRVGYDFAGWSLTPQGTAPYDQTQPVRFSFSLYARWLPLGDAPKETYLVTAYSDGNVLQEKQVLCGDTVDFDVPILVGYVFDGWYVDESMAFAFDPTLPVTSSFEVYARWKESPRLQVRFETGGGNTISPFSVKYNSLLIRPAAPVRDGFDFLGWQDEAGTPFDFATDRVTKNIVLYAIWQPKPQTAYTVTFVKNNGEQNETLTFVDSLPVLIIPTKTGSLFEGWFVDEELTISYESVQKIPSVLTLYAKWNDEVSSEGFTFVLSSDGEGYVVSKYDHDAIQVVIPDKINGVSVVEVGEYAFADSGVQTVSIPQTVRTIGNFAFSGSSELKEVAFASDSQLVQVGKSAFFGTNLQQIRLGSSVTLVDSFAFQSTPLVNVVVEGRAHLAESAFADCKSLKYFAGRNVTYVDVNCFSLCNALTEVYLDQCAILCTNAFAGCTSLKTLDLPRCLTIQSGVFENDVDLTSVTMPLVTQVGARAFYNCAKLRSVSLPSVDSLGQETFGYCMLLGEVRLGSGFSSLGELCFDQCTNVSFVFDSKNPDYYTSDGSLLKGTTLIMAGNIAEDGYHIPAVVEIVDVYAFCNLSQTTALYVNAKVRDLGLLVGMYLPLVTNIIVDEANQAYSVDEDGDLYKGRTLVRYIDRIDRSDWTMKEGMSIAIGAFAGCQYLTEITLSDDYTIIASGAFYNCGSLRNVLNVGHVQVIETAAFAGCVSLQEIEWPEGITIQDQAFDI